MSTMSNRSRNKSEQQTDLRMIDKMHSLKVDNLAYRTRVIDLKRCFEKFGPIGDIYVPRDQFSHSNRGYAFVRFLEKRDAEHAIDRMDRADIDGREIRVQLARYNRGASTSGRNKLRSRRSRSGSKSRRRSRDRSRSTSADHNRNDHRHSRSRPTRRSRSRSRSQRKNHSESDQDDNQHDNK
ncbi:hypothetical protein I4U23_018380 [Adineta vaga]|nr:hypothetical protein I4U23_018380 [Adineta vaga]